jgi:predicted flap endonuclease-1-like 5' DNA nuclease
MRFSRGIIFGFLIGTVIGVLIYLKHQRENGTSVAEMRSMRIHLPDGPEKTDPAPQPPSDPQPEAPSEPLEAVSGIGKIRANRLQEGGIKSLADLAATTPERVREILGSRVSLDVAAGFITQAMSLI